MNQPKNQLPRKLVIHIDGACRGNPGPASIGILIEDGSGQIVKEISETIGTATNNIAEYFALIAAMQEASVLQAQELDVFTDSQLLARQYSGEYKVKDSHMKIMMVIIRRLKNYFIKCDVHHVPREENKKADELANFALDSSL